MKSEMYGSSDDGSEKSDTSLASALSKNSIMLAAMKKETERVRIK